MKKIKVTIIIAGMQEYPSCEDLLATCPEFQILAQAGSTDEVCARRMYASSDILILDDATIEQEGTEVIRELHTRHVSLKSLLIVDNYSENSMITSLSFGISGILTRDSMVSRLRQALTAIYSGEAWVPRGLIAPLRDELLGVERMAHWTKQSQVSCAHDRMH